MAISEGAVVRDPHTGAIFKVEKQSLRWYSESAYGLAGKPAFRAEANLLDRMVRGRDMPETLAQVEKEREEEIKHLRMQVAQLNIAKKVLAGRDVQTFTVNLHNAMNAAHMRDMLLEKLSRAEKHRLEYKEDTILVIQHGAGNHSLPGPAGQFKNVSRGVAEQWLRGRKLPYRPGAKPNTLVHQLIYRS